MERVIISGADGFIGYYTTNHFLEQGIKVLALGRPEMPHRLKEHPNLKYMQCDVTNTLDMLDRVPHDVYDTFIHFAWVASAGKGRFDYRLQMQNAINTVECMKAAKLLGCKRFLCAGSIMEREVSAVISDQGSKPGMGYIYGMGKLIAHCMCKSVAADIGIELVWPMITNAYGVGENSPRMINTTLRRIINHEPLQFTAATQNYDFVYVTDVAKAFYLVAQKGKPFSEYLIGSGHARPLKEFLIEMQEELAPEQKCLFGDIPFTGKNMPLATFDTSDIVNDCGFEAEISFAEGTKMTMDWLRNSGGVFYKHNKSLCNYSYYSKLSFLCCQADYNRIFYSACDVYRDTYQEEVAA